MAMWLLQLNENMFISIPTLVETIDNDNGPWGMMKPSSWHCDMWNNSSIKHHSSYSLNPFYK